MVNTDILEKKGKTGHIKLKGCLENGDIVFIMQDDGIGIPEGKVTNLLFADRDAKDTHDYGIRNINSRIILYYGEQYGLSYTSIVGAGTTVTIRIPAIKITLHTD